MFNRLSVTAILFALLACTAVIAQQSLCPAGVISDKLICLLPQLYGVNGFVLGNPDPLGQFKSSFLSSSLKPLNSALARQSALLPLASPSSGIIYSWAGRIPSSSTDSFGPILGERAETIGKSHVFLGFGYQYFKFDSLDGVDVKKLPIVLTQQDFNLNGTTCSANAPDNNPSPSPSSTGACGFIRDVVKTDNTVDLKIHQFTTFFALGITKRIDVAMVIPINNVRMGVFSNAMIVNNSQSLVHIFPSHPGCGSQPSDPPPFMPCRNNLFSSVRNVSGIGDITLRAKGIAWQGERAGLGLGVDIRLPTGDSLNFLGAGAAGVKPFIVWSYRSRISPHAVVGYEVNGSSQIAGDLTTGTKERLPSQLTYAAGADVWLTNWFTAAFDLAGQQVFEAKRTSVTSLQEPSACKDSACLPPNFDPPKHDLSLSPATGTFNITNASVGVKVRPFSNLLITANALIKLNEGGLRANVVPLVGISYTF
jgi:hypothetical protein